MIAVHKILQWICFQHAICLTCVRPGMVILACFKPKSPRSGDTDEETWRLRKAYSIGGKICVSRMTRGARIGNGMSTNTAPAGNAG